MWNLNEAESGGAPAGELIPDKTVARAILSIRPGGHGDGGWFKVSKGGDLMLDCEFTITEGPYARRKVWRYMMATGNETAVKITMAQMRAAIEGHFGILPTDQSPEAVEKRTIRSIEQLNGIECCVMVGIEAAKDGYEAKNTIKAIIAPGEGKYIPPGGGGAPQGAAVAAAAAIGGGNPSGFVSAPVAAAAAPQKATAFGWG